MIRTGLLLSGGMDSAAVAYLVRPDVALTIDYGQLPAEAEARAAEAIASSLGIPHHVLHIDCRGIGSGDLIGRPPLVVAPATDWWPFRNQLLVTLAAAYLLPMGIGKLIFGTVKTDEFHADGRPEFFAAMSALLALQEGGLEIEAPAANLTSAELIVKSGIPPSVLAWAHSCHKANLACGRCRGCNKHFEVTGEIGLEPY